MPKTATPSKDGKRHPLNMRTTKDMRDRLERAAVESGRSLAQEVEYRLDRSFVDDSLFSSREMHLWAVMLADQFHKAGSQAAAHSGEDPSDRGWQQNPTCMMIATLSAMQHLMRDFVRLPGTGATDAKSIIDQLMASTGSELVHAGKAKWIGPDGREVKVSGFIGDDDAR